MHLEVRLMHDDRNGNDNKNSALTTFFNFKGVMKAV